jgi:hypothetical protein
MSRNHTNNFLMVKKLFLSLPGQMLKKFFGKQGLLKFLFFYVPGETIKFFDFELERAGKIKIFILLCARRVRDYFLETNNKITLVIANSYDNFLLKNNMYGGLQNIFQEEG